MSIASPRYLEKFESADGARSVSLTRDRVEWDSSQGLRLALVPTVGADYAVDLLGSDSATKEPGAERLRFMVDGASAGAVDAALDSLKATCQRIGRGKLFTVDSAGARRWAWARLASMPSFSLGVFNFYSQPAALEFTRLSDWFGETLQTHTETIAATPHTFSLTTQGNAPVQAVVIRFRANGAGGYTNPKLRNKTNGENFQVMRVAAGANDEIRVDTGRWACEVSTDDGLSYTSTLTDLTLGDTQFNIITLAEGLNELEFTDGGIPDLELVIEYHETWH